MVNTTQQRVRFELLCDSLVNHVGERGRFDLEAHLLLETQRVVQQPLQHRVRAEVIVSVAQQHIERGPELLQHATLLQDVRRLLGCAGEKTV